METGSELSKTVATFIVQKMLLDEMGLTYVCATAERFYAVCRRIWTSWTLSSYEHSPRHWRFFINEYPSWKTNLQQQIDSIQTQVSTVLSGMVSKLLENPSVRLLKHIVRCYLRLSEHPRWHHDSKYHFFPIILVLMLVQNSRLLALNKLLIYDHL